MRKITYLPKPMSVGDDERVETGPLQIGEDWPGFFIRGDQALHFSTQLQQHMRKHFDEVPTLDAWEAFEQGQLMGWATLIESCNAQQASKPAEFVIVPVETARMSMHALELTAKEVAETWPGQLGISELTMVNDHIEILKALLPPEEEQKPT